MIAGTGPSTGSSTAPGSSSRSSRSTTSTTRRSNGSSPSTCGHADMVRAFLPHLLARPEGHIVNVSSMGGFLPFPGQTIYGAQGRGEAADRGAGRGALDTNVRVSVIFPGAIDTAITENSGVDGHLPTPRATCRSLSPAKAARIMINGHREGQAAHLRRPGLPTDEPRHKGCATTRDPVRAEADEQATPGLAHPGDTLTGAASLDWVRDMPETAGSSGADHQPPAVRTQTSYPIRTRSRSPFAQRSSARSHALAVVRGREPFEEGLGEPLTPSHSV